MVKTLRVCLIVVIGIHFLSSQESPEQATVMPGQVIDLISDGRSRYLAVVLENQSTLHIYDAGKTTVVREIPLLPGKPVLAVGGDRLLVFYPENDLLQTWDLATGAKLMSGRNPCPGRISYLALSVDGTRAIARGMEREGNPNTAFHGLLATDTHKPLEPIEHKSKASAPPPGESHEPMSLWTSPDLGRTVVWHAHSHHASRYDRSLMIDTTIAGQVQKKILEGSYGYYVVGGDDGCWYTGNGTILDGQAKLRYQSRGICLLPLPGALQFIAVDEFGDLRLHHATDPNSSAPLGRFPGWHLLVGNGTYAETHQRLLVSGSYAYDHLSFARRTVMPLEGTRLVMLSGDNRTLVNRDLSTLHAVQQDPGGGMMVVSHAKTTAIPGTEWKHRLEVASRPGPLSFALLDGPPGASITSAGVVHWQVPERPSQNPCRFSVRITRGTGAQAVPLNHTFAVTLGSNEIFAKIPVEPYPDEGPGRYLCNDQVTSMALRHNGQGMWLLRGKRLDVLDESGMHILGSIPTEEGYRRILDRGEYLIGIAATRIDLIDPNTGRIRQKIPVECIDITDVVAHPRLPLCYLALLRDVSDGSDLMRRRIAVLDEKSGKVEILHNAFGSSLALYPDGSALFSTLSAEATRSVAFIEHFRSFRLVHRLTEISRTELVISYRVMGNQLVPNEIHDQIGNGITALSMAPDGGALAVCMQWPGKFLRPQWQEPRTQLVAPGRLQQTIGSLGGNEQVRDIAFHPYLDLVAIASESNTVRLFRRSSGEPLAHLDRILEPRGGVTFQIIGRRIWFTPDGRSIAALNGEETGRHNYRNNRITISRLRLSPEDEMVVAKRQAPALRPLPRIDEAARPADQLALRIFAEPLKRPDLTILNKAPNVRSMKPADIAAASNKLVVTVVKGDVSATGFHVGPTCILTSATVVDEDGRIPPRVIRALGQKKSREEKNVKIRAVDRNLGLALLTIGDPATDGMSLEKDDLHQLGEPVVTIASPVLGPTVLDLTMSEGVISNANRVFGDLKLIQASVPLPPGSQGAPLFGPRGNLVGMMLFAGEGDRISFALPSSAIRKFLVATTTSTPKAIP